MNSITPENPEPLLKFYEVLCPKCRARPGYPCTFGESNTPAGKKPNIDPWSIHISRVLLYEAFALGTVNELGIGKNGIPIKGGIPE
jgi:hypothetical protein